MSFANMMDESMMEGGLNPNAAVYIPKSKREEKKEIHKLFDSVSSIILSMEMDLEYDIGKFSLTEDSLTVYLSNESILTFTPVDNDIYHYHIFIQYCIVEGYDWKPYMNECMDFTFSKENPIDQAIAEFIHLSSQSSFEEDSNEE